jgi:hypothetical protein
MGKDVLMESPIVLSAWRAFQQHRWTSARSGLDDFQGWADLYGEGAVAYIQVAV